MRYTFEDVDGRRDLFHTTNPAIAESYANRHGLRIIAGDYTEAEEIPLVAKKQPMIVPTPIIFVGAFA